MFGFRSKSYWIRRYRQGKTSGAGSYGRLAAYKAKYINDLVARMSISRVIEFGSGDGNQAALFDFPEYTGVDVSPLVVRNCASKFADRTGWRFVVRGTERFRGFDLAMSLDVIYHLIEDRVFDSYMTDLFDASQRFVLIYASDVDDRNTGADHVRHRRYSDWIETHRPDWQLVEAPPQPYPFGPGSDPNQTSFASFKLFRLDTSH